MKNQLKSNRLIARIREDADAKEKAGKVQMARKTRFAANSLEQCFGKNVDFELEQIDKAWLDKYLIWLQENGKTDNTISNYFRVILSTFRSAVKSGICLDLSLFDNFFTGNSKSTRQILSIDDVKRILNTDLDDSVFKRTRDIFALCFMGGGLQIDDLNSENVDNRLSRLERTTESRTILNRYCKHDLFTFLGRDYKDAYLHNLSGLMHKLNIPINLDDDSAAEGWAEVAKSIGISHTVISNVIGRSISNLNYAADVASRNDEITKALVSVARCIGVNTQHWYAIRCYEDSPEDTASNIEKLEGLKSIEVKHFFLQEPEGKKKAAAQNNNYMKSILFINCLDADIYYIRRTLAPAIYVFDYVCANEKRPASISDKEMKTFMYLAGIGSDTMMYYFPEEIENIPSYAEYDDVTIMEGIFAGVKAKVHKKSKEKLNVIVRFEQANIWYTVDIPYSLLKPITEKE
jgi:transcription antitermination factor NusG